MVSNESSSSPSAAPSSTPPPQKQSRGGSTERIFTISILALVGVAFGLSLFTFSYAKGFSYLSNDPAACVNCHVMNEQYDAWSHSSHKAVATCNDCHTPHRFPDKWVIKGVNGWNHSVAFTTGNFPDPIRIRGFNANIAQENCVDCHATTVSQMHLTVDPLTLDCIACHGNVGHANEAIIAPRAVPAWYGQGTTKTMLEHFPADPTTPEQHAEMADEDSNRAFQAELEAAQEANEEPTGEPDATSADSTPENTTEESDAIEEAGNE